ncbi:hypothetical protein [Methylocystis sp. B8]|uniref:hypothetical protein n=1 Tax=Methylocystis sp. B8 TaxID=544938 RepID=UPI0010FE9C71|nr:hypothetical protein [Methylocystis sp. B8]TLG72786.1 hypothetical protein FEV16_13575 [Methylocystis sp. B8]
MKRKVIPFVGDDGARRGRPAIETVAATPNGFEHYDELMQGLNAYGWYKEIAARLRREVIAQRYSDEELRGWKEQGLAPYEDPTDIDRFMYRTEPVAVVRDAKDLRIANCNDRLVVEIDVNVHDDVLIRSLKAVIDGRRAQRPRRSRFSAWTDHRILALFDLRLMGYNLDGERTQLALWLFPEIENAEVRGRKFDRARGYLDDAIASQDSLRAYPE